MIISIQRMHHLSITQAQQNESYKINDSSANKILKDEENKRMSCQLGVNVETLKLKKQKQIGLKMTKEKFLKKKILREETFFSV